MYSIRLATNYLKYNVNIGDRATIGVLLSGGEYRFYQFLGFTAERGQDAKCKVEAVYPAFWDPREGPAQRSAWTHLKPGEHLLGRYEPAGIRTLVPYLIV
jgi:hypothetical protein